MLVLYLHPGLLFDHMVNYDTDTLNNMLYVLWNQYFISLCYMYQFLLIRLSELCSKKFISIALSLSFDSIFHQLKLISSYKY